MDEKKPVAFSTGEEEKQAALFDTDNYLEEREKAQQQRLLAAQKEREDLQQKREEKASESSRLLRYSLVVLGYAMIVGIAFIDRINKSKGVETEQPQPPAVTQQDQVKEVTDAPPLQEPAEKPDFADAGEDDSILRVYDGNKAPVVGGYNIPTAQLGQEVHVDGYVIYNHEGEMITDYLYSEENAVLLSPSSRDLVAVLYKGEFSIIGTDLKQGTVDTDVKKILMGKEGIFYLTNEGRCRFLRLWDGKIFQLDTNIVDFCLKDDSGQSIIALKNDNGNYYGERMAYFSVVRLEYEGNYIPVLHSSTWTETYMTDAEGNFYQHNAEHKLTELVEDGELISAANDGNTIFVRQRSTGDIYYFYSSYGVADKVLSDYDEAVCFMNYSGTASFAYIVDGSAYMADIERDYVNKAEPVVRYSIEDKTVTDLVCDGNNYGNAWYYTSDGSIYYGYRELKGIVATGINCKSQTLKLDAVNKLCYYKDGDTICRVGTKDGSSEVVAENVKDFTELPGKEEVIAYTDKSGDIYWLCNGEFLKY